MAPVACKPPDTGRDVIKKWKKAMSFAPDLDERAAILSLVAHPTRLRLAYVLDQLGEVCVCDLVAPIGKSQPTVSHHLKVLADAGLVTSERRGRWAWYRAVPEQLERLRGVLQP